AAPEERPYDAVQFAARHDDAVADQSDNPAGSGHAPHLGVIGRQVEPVRGLAAVARSTARAGRPLTPAGAQRYSTFGCGAARAICSALASVATTRSNGPARSTDSWPEPQPASHASRLSGAGRARKSTSAAGSEGRCA